MFTFFEVKILQWNIHIRNKRNNNNTLLFNDEKEFVNFANANNFSNIMNKNQKKLNKGNSNYK